MNQASNRRESNEEILISEIGQVGTQFDGFAYQTIADKRQNLQLQPGDAVIIHTGWGKLWGKDSARYGKNCALGNPANRELTPFWKRGKVG